MINRSQNFRSGMYAFRGLLPFLLFMMPMARTVLCAGNTGNNRCQKRLNNSCNVRPVSRLLFFSLSLIDATLFTEAPPDMFPGFSRSQVFPHICEEQAGSCLPLKDSSSGFPWSLQFQSCCDNKGYPQQSFRYRIF